MDFVERTCVRLCIFLHRAIFVLRTHGWELLVCDSLLHASSFVLCGSSVKQVSHSWNIVLDTCALYAFLNFTYLFISLVNLYPDSELTIINIITKIFHSVYRSLEIHNFALTSSPSPLSPPWDRATPRARKPSALQRYPLVVWWHCAALNHET